MIGLAFRFDLGRYHANPWGAHVNEATVEWPPSPWRILRALYAVSRTNTRLSEQRDLVDEALRKLASADPPSYELPATTTAHTRHFVPSRLYSALRPDETDKVLDGFLAVDPDAELVTWWDVALAGGEREALESAAEALGYLGRSESVCSARLVEGAPSGELAAAPATAHPDDAEGETIRLLCPDGEDPLAALSVSVGEVRRRRLATPEGTRWVEYRVRRPEPAAPPPPEPEAPTLARYRVTGKARPSIREAVTVASLLRSALQARYGRRNDGGASPVFSGRAGDRPRTDQHQHAHYLVTPDAANRRVAHVVVWAKEGFGPEEVAALAELSEIKLREAPEPLRLVLTALGRPEEMRLPSLLGPSATWRSLTPFALPRHPKRRRSRIVDGPEDQIRRELALRGLPEPREVRLIRGSWLEYRRTRPGRPSLEAPRAVGARLVFGEPIRGPLALGALSHFGLGLFVPER